MGSDLKNSYPIRLLGVSGYEDRKNDVVYCRPLVETDNPNVVVFFPGDVQDFTENMEAHRDNKNHKQWNLDSTAQIMQNKFSDCHILVVKPSRMDFKTFSCYPNFVDSNQLGVPNHTPNHHSICHLDSLVKNASKTLQNLSQPDLEKAIETSKKALVCQNGSNRIEIPDNINNSSYTQVNFDSSSCHLKLIGFSKGCVVLNQMLHEYHNFASSVDKNDEVMRVISRVEDMFWLDGGHSGGKNTWVTNKEVLGTVAHLGINIHVHVTPYQIKDDRRPWIKKEEKSFSDTLSKLGCKIERTVHFEAVPPSIITHFEVLNTFKK